MAGPGPRYTCYPTAPEWTDDFAEADALAAYAARRERPRRAALALRAPALLRRDCASSAAAPSRSRSHATASSATSTRSSARSRPWPRALGARRASTQLHWGGGTPTLPLAGAARSGCTRALAAALHASRPTPRSRIEVDPHVTTREQVDAADRARLQPRVAWACRTSTRTCRQVVHRDQTLRGDGRARRAAAAARGIESVNVDLMYGLPEQTRGDASRARSTTLARDAARPPGGLRLRARAVAEAARRRRSSARTCPDAPRARAALRAGGRARSARRATSSSASTTSRCASDALWRGAAGRHAAPQLHGLHDAAPARRDGRPSA